LLEGPNGVGAEVRLILPALPVASAPAKEDVKEMPTK
jgi:hypothetical protein